MQHLIWCDLIRYVPYVFICLYWPLFPAVFLINIFVQRSLGYAEMMEKEWEKNKPPEEDDDDDEDEEDEWAMWAR